MSRKQINRMEQDGRRKRVRDHININIRFIVERPVWYRTPVVCVREIFSSVIGYRLSTATRKNITNSTNSKTHVLFRLAFRVIIFSIRFRG